MVGNRRANRALHAQFVGEHKIHEMLIPSR
jgi:hypothetical protein